MELEGVHGGERDGEGGQQVRYGQGYNEDISEKIELDLKFIFSFQGEHSTLCCRNRLLLSQ